MTNGYGIGQLYVIFVQPDSFGILFTLITKVHTDCFAIGELKPIVRDQILYTV